MYSTIILILEEKISSRIRDPNRIEIDLRFSERVKVHLFDTLHFGREVSYWVGNVDTGILENNILLYSFL